MHAGGHSSRQALVAAALVLALVAAFFVARAAEQPAKAADAVSAKKKKKKRAGGYTIRTNAFTQGEADNRTRYEVLCPKGKFPLGGGMSFSPAPDPGGEGVYPNSYERLGQQGGYHITAALVDLRGGPTESRKIELQVACVSKKPGRVTPPHQTVFVDPGQTKQLTIRCPGKRYLIGGGYQRTTFVSNGGDQITESRAISSTAWRVTGTARRGFGGELTAFAYCVQSKKPLVTEVKASTMIDNQSPGQTTTPSCPKGRKLGFVGFEAPSSGDLVYMGSSLELSQTSTATAFHDGGPNSTPQTLTAYGYCIKP